MFIVPKRFRGIKRFEEILKILAKHELGFLLEKTKLKKKSLKKGKGISHPVELKIIFEELGGSFIKLGQLLSLRPDLIPQKYCEELSKLQDSVHQIPFSDVSHVIKAGLKKPINKIFKNFDKKPIAAASIGQVHVARLKNGKKVAVKIMRPGIKALFETDLEILEHLSRIMKYHFDPKFFDPEQIFNEFKQYTENELDYLKEAHNIRLFFEKNKGSRKIKIPKVYNELTTKNILVMEFLEGKEVKDIILNPGRHKRVDKKKVCKLIVDSLMKQIFVDGVFHADPHPSNILVRKNGIGFLDFGIIGRINKTVRDEVGLLLISLISGDANRIVESMKLLKIVGKNVNVNLLKQDLRETLGEYYNTSIVKIDMADLFFKSIHVARKHKVKIPKEFVMLGKTLVTVQGVCLELDPEFNLVQETKPVIKTLIRKRSNPSRLMKNIVEETERFAMFVYDLPEQSKRLQGTLEKADVALDTINQDLKELTHEIITGGKILVLGLILVGVIIAASLIYQNDPNVAKILLVVAGLLLIWTFSVLLKKK